MKNSNVSTLTRVLLLLSTVFLTGSLFLPIWRIELSAPQYPEGLVMLIYSNKLGGSVDIINGLNHYIGMQTLHAEDFIEFTVLPYIISAFAVFALIASIVAKKKIVIALFIAFVLFGILAMIDFWRWEYNYGHNLSSDAPIQVPGMSYQPPLIGFKQLLNFGAYSIPDSGGWLFIGSGLMMLISVIKEVRTKQITLNKASALTSISAILFVISSCSTSTPKPIKLNSDACEFCKMTISDGRFGAELITEKGRIYTFDDLGCLLRYRKTNDQSANASIYVHRNDGTNELINAATAFYVSAEKLNSPMGGNYAAFSTKEKASEMASELEGDVTDWKTIIQE